MKEANAEGVEQSPAAKVGNDQGLKKLKVDELEIKNGDEVINQEDLTTVIAVSGDENEHATALGQTHSMSLTKNDISATGGTADWLSDYIIQADFVNPHKPVYTNLSGELRKDGLWPSSDFSDFLLDTGINFAFTFPGLLEEGGGRCI